MAKNKKTVKALRNALYEQANLVNSKGFDHQKAKTLYRAAAVVISSYKVQLEALKMAGRGTEGQDLPGLLDK